MNSKRKGASRMTVVDGVNVMVGSPLHRQLLAAKSRPSKPERLTGRAAELAEQLFHTQRELAKATNRARLAEVTVSALQAALARERFGEPETAESIANPIPF